MIDQNTLEEFAVTMKSEYFLEEDDFFKTCRLEAILYWYWANYQDVHKYNSDSERWYERAENDISKGDDYGWVEDHLEVSIKQTVRKLIYESLGSVLGGSKVADFDLFKELAKIALWMRGSGYTDHVIELIKSNFYSGGKVPEHPSDYQIHLLDSDVESALLSDLDLTPPQQSVRME